jgi:hypothetical protein
VIIQKEFKTYDHSFSMEAGSVLYRTLMEYRETNPVIGNPDIRIHILRDPQRLEEQNLKALRYVRDLGIPVDTETFNADFDLVMREGTPCLIPGVEF